MIRSPKSFIQKLRDSQRDFLCSVGRTVDVMSKLNSQKATVERKLSLNERNKKKNILSSNIEILDYLNI